MSEQIVIDLSHWQPDPIDWDAVKAGGTVGVILKATEDTDYVDPTFAERQEAARRAGLFTATYHFLRPGDPRDQMQFYVDAVNPSEGERLVIDFEDYDLTFEELESAVDHLFSITQCEVTVYGSNVLVEKCKGRKSPILAKTSLWQARYSGSPPSVPTNIWPTWSLWQYTQMGSVEGIAGDVDLNRWNGDPAKLPGWFDANYVAPSPTPEPEPPEVTVRITVEAPQGVTILVNGTEVKT